MDRAQADFEVAFDELFDQAARVATRLLGDRAAGDDVAAEALAPTWLRWSRIGPLPHRTAWVLRVATNLSLDALRRRRPPVAAVAAPDHADSTAVRLALVAALRALPKRQRQVVVLRHLAGLPEADVAATLGISPGTVGAHLHRAMAALRRRLGDDLSERDLALGS